MHFSGYKCRMAFRAFNTVAYGRCGIRHVVMAYKQTEGTVDSCNYFFNSELGVGAACHAGACYRRGGL